MNLPSSKFAPKRGHFKDTSWAGIHRYYEEVTLATITISERYSNLHVALSYVPRELSLFDGFLRYEKSNQSGGSSKCTSSITYVAT